MAWTPSQNKSKLELEELVLHLNMSHEEAVDTTTTACCAACGTAEVDDVVLEECDACKLVRYCSNKCREEHREQHDRACKEEVVKAKLAKLRELEAELREIQSKKDASRSQSQHCESQLDHDQRDEMPRRLSPIRKKDGTPMTAPEELIGALAFHHRVMEKIDEHPMRKQNVKKWKQIREEALAEATDRVDRALSRMANDEEVVRKAKKESKARIEREYELARESFACGTNYGNTEVSEEDEEADEVCANCGKVEMDEVKLQKCTACKFVRYCSDICREEHFPQHKVACQERVGRSFKKSLSQLIRMQVAAEIRDKELFRQPDESHLGDCLICFLPLPIDEIKSIMMPCCCKWICEGCSHANKKREKEQGLEHKCPYCREPAPENQEEAEKILVKRVKANDPMALFEMGGKCYQEGDYGEAFKYWKKTAELGDISAHYELGLMYSKGEGVEKDEKKAVYHWEKAAIGGHPAGRYNLGVDEWKKGNLERAAKHYIIAAKLGLGKALGGVKKCYMREAVSKEDFAAALRGHQAAVDATKSKQREKGYAHLRLDN